ncbi:MAG TPA: hypothetical protein VG735_05600 [Caulobacterales bacterium]|nr:hypothetical protein [Caulobacterales bacterium]
MHGIRKGGGAGLLPLAGIFEAYFFARTTLRATRLAAALRAGFFAAAFLATLRAAGLRAALRTVFFAAFFAIFGAFFAFTTLAILITFRLKSCSTFFPRRRGVSPGLKKHYFGCWEVYLRDDCICANLYAAITRNMRFTRIFAGFCAARALENDSLKMTRNKKICIKRRKIACERL